MRPCARKAFTASTKASALCIYHGKDNAQTTLAEEFKDAAFVVKAKVLSARDYRADGQENWTSYRVEVEHIYKGYPAKRLKFFTYRDSGGFYMDRPWVRLPAGHDIGASYLLFLNPIQPRADYPRAAIGAVFVNYSCGRSGPWAGVSSDDRKTLITLEDGS